MSRFPPRYQVDDLVFLSDLPKDEPVVISGLNDLSFQCLSRLLNAGYSVGGFVDTEHRGSVLGFPVFRYSDLDQLHCVVFADDGIGHVLEHLDGIDCIRAYDWGTALKFFKRHMLAIVDGRAFDPIEYVPQFPPSEYARPYRAASDVDINLPGEKYFVNVGCYDCKTHDPCYPFVERGYAGLEVDARPLKSETHQAAIENVGGAKDIELVFGYTALPDNVVSLLAERGCPKEFALLKIDIDSWDFYILQPILDYGFRPAIVQIEVNTCFPVSVDFAVKMQGTSQSPVFPNSMHGFHGVSLGMVDRYLKEKGYALVGCDFGYPDMPAAQRDAVYVREDMPVRTVSAAAALDREPIAFTHFRGDLGYDTNKWRVPGGASRYREEML